MQCPVVQALLTDRALIDDGVRSVARQCQRGDCLAQRVEPRDASDKVPRTLVHLFARGHPAVRSDGVERRVPEAHDPIGVASEEPRLVFGVSRGKLAPYSR